MELRDAVTIADEVMAETGLAAKGWTWRWGKGIKTLGHCSFRRREIVLYRPFTGMATPAEVREVMLHEAAHALVGVPRDRHGRRAPHGEEWKAKARELGIAGNRCGANPYYRQLKEAERAAKEAALVAALPRAGARVRIELLGSKLDGLVGVIVAETDERYVLEIEGREVKVPKGYATKL